MPLKDVLVAALSRPAARVVDAPVREIIEEVLRDHGYASPADLARIKDDLAGLAGKVAPLERALGALEGQLSGLRDEAAGLRAALAKAEAELAASRVELAASRVELAEAKQALADAQASLTAAPPPAAAPTCKVPGCGGRVASSGFCRSHLLSWRAGRLAGYVSPEGLIALGGGAGRVGLALAGEPYAVDGGRVRVGGRETSAVAL